MGQTSYRANLSAASFPLVISKAGRTVIDPQIDQNFDRRLDISGDIAISKASIGLPQVMFMQDIVPTVEGFQSVTHRLDTPNNPPLGGSSIVAMIKLSVPTTASLKELVRLVFFADATVRSAKDLTEGFTTWNAVTMPGSWTNPVNENSMHWGTAQGVTYLLRSDIGKLYTISGTGPTVFTDVTGTITGTPGGVSLCCAYNYVITAAFDTVTWSSLTSGVDFVASLISGAGNEKPAGNETNIRFLLPHPTGFFIYTSNNVISARYTGNRAYPWRFIPIADSGFVVSKSQVGWNAESTVHFAPVATGVIHQISYDKADIVLTELSEYLEKEPYYDSFNSGTNVFTRVDKSEPTNFLALQCRILQDKYLYLSHIQPGGLGTPYKHCFIYDIATKRYGKLVKDHSYVDEYRRNPVLVNFGTGGAPLNIVSYVEYNINKQTVGTYVAAGVIMFGRFSYLRDRLFCIESLDIQSVQSTEFIAGVDRQFSVFLLLSQDGINFDTIFVPTLAFISTILASYNVHNPETFEVCILIKGAFNIQSLSMQFTMGGTL